METTSRKILSVLLAVIMVLSIVPMAGVTSFAETSGDYEYEVLSETDKTCKITDYTGSATELAIPSELNGYKVTEIGSFAFDDCISLTSVTIPNLVKYIGNFAFERCTSLISITIPDSVTNISWDAFLYCISLTSVTIPDSVTSIGNEAFRGCTSLTSVTIPNSVTSIGNDAFNNTAYYNNEGNWENSVLYIGKHLIEAKNDLNGDYSIKKGTKTIAKFAFFSCTLLTSVTIPNSVTNIDDYALYDCISLSSITIPKSVTQIGEDAFGYCDDENYFEEKIDGFTIYGYKGTAAESYANENGFTFINLDAENVSMHRLYNPNSGEHFYTADENERNNLVSVGWKYEGIGWTAPITSDKPVYRLYNQNGGEHHYTLDASERDFLVSLGWKFEDIGWYSADTDGIPLYRQYNPNAFANNHNYTADKSENDWLVSLGWKAEGIGWYGVA